MRTRTSRHGKKMNPGALLEPLEQRAMLSLNNFPLITDLQNPTDTVVRLQTNFGDIDIEMFDQAAPITVANFLKYVHDGDYDQTFFHRLADNGSDPFVLQGGGYRLKGLSTTGTFDGADAADQQWYAVPTDPPITNEFNQSNVARTVAMARVGGQDNSATSQFFFNLVDNSSILDNPQGFTAGFTVFGRIANDASWNVVMAIESGTTINTSGSTFANTSSGSPDGLPVHNGFTGTNVNSSQLVTINDAEVIKPQGVAAFYTYRVYYPEGFAGSTINEFLPLGNPGASTVYYQVILRSETSDTPSTSATTSFWYRDKVINSSTIGPNQRGGITMSQFQDAAENLVPEQGKPYAIEVWATGPIDATLSHYDFGSSTIESFTQTPATTWTFPDVKKGTDISDFLIWDNTTDTTANLTLTFYKNDGSTPITVPMTVEPFRRGGIAIADTASIPDMADYSVQITSDQMIIAAESHYQTSGAAKGGATQLGIAGATGHTKGVLPLASNGPAGSGISDTLSIVVPGSAGAVVTIIARFDDGSPDVTITQIGLVLMPNSRSEYTVPDSPALDGKSFSILYQSNQPVYVSTLHVEHGDVASNPFSNIASIHEDFGEGFMNAQRAGNDLFESIGIFNPNGAFFGLQPQDADVTLRFLFSDGFVLSEDFTVAADSNLLINLTTYQPLLDQSAHGRYYFSLDVVSDVPVVAMMSHYDTSLGGLQPSGGDSTLGTPRGQLQTFGT